MFRKKPNIKSYAPLRSSDRRKLLTQIVEKFGLSADTLPAETKELILPSDIRSAKFTAHATGERGSVFVGSDVKPLWIELDDNTIVPTVYLLWKCPFLIPTVHTWPPVIEKLRNGADMMLPGLIPPFPDGLVKGSIVAIASADSPTVPLAVGICDLTLTGVTRVQGQHGKAVLIVQVHGDELPVKGNISVPKELDWEVPRIEETTEVKKITEVLERADISQDVQESSAKLLIEQEPQPITELTNSELDSGSQSQPQQVSEGPSTAEIDEAFRQALIYTIYESRTEYPISFPQISSTFISSYILPHLHFSYASTPIKQTSWKKAAKFFKAMDKEGLLKTKEKGGDVTILSIAGLDHADVKNFKPYRTAGQKKSSHDNGLSENAEKTEGKLIVKEYYQFKEKTKQVGQVLDKSTSAYYTSPELRAVVLEYVDKEELVSSENPRQLIYNPLLSSFFPKRPKLLTREVLLDRVKELCAPLYRVYREGENEAKVKLAKGVPPKVEIIVAMKQGHKITRILNVEAYKIDPHDLANELRTECASSTTVNKTLNSGASSTKLEINIQGPQSKAASEVLERHGVKKTWIEITNNTKSKG
ncbi:hypothetical protein V1514DRAFT_339275 [Lipomyces japonicus]|uniref:uncharacterized protein n=1 Tax=Lipomyces japonicus TaxID=56871 RepID=UPI0034CDA3C5